MANPITDTDYVSLLVKKVIYGVTETGGATDSSRKAPSAETIKSPLIIPVNTLWAQSSALPLNPANAGGGLGYIPYIMAHYKGTTAAAPSATNNAVPNYQVVQMTKDPTVSDGSTWFATATVDNIATRLTNWVPFSFGSGYSVIVRKNSATGTIMDPNDVTSPYIFDYGAGVIQFPTTAPSGVTSLYIEGYRYIGQLGISSNFVVADMATLATTSGTLGTIAYVTNAGNGEAATYLYTSGTPGSGLSNWQLIGTYDSSSVDSRTYFVTVDTALSPPSTISLGKISSGRKITNVTVQVSNSFDGGATISVGDGSVVDRFMSTSENDLSDSSSTDGYTTTPSYIFAGTSGGRYTATSQNTTADTEIFVYYTANSATTGRAVVAISYQ